ncbi:MAG: hypothetical protein HY059_09480 [Proteobacteria bacterium]|nr:hypothetical protein [Pseudomonadota bacterium]
MISRALPALLLAALGATRLIAHAQEEDWRLEFFPLIKREGRIVLVGAGKDSLWLLSNRHALRQWTERTSTGANSCPDAAPTPSAGATRLEIDATGCVPARAAELLDRRPNIGGPNCWNIALVLADILPALRFSTPEEFAFHMASARCRPLSAGEALLPGDLGAMREKRAGGGERELHAFVRISSDLAFSKNGDDPVEPYQVHAMSAMLQANEALGRANCRGACSIRTDYYRCLPASSAIPFGALSEAERRLSKFESSLEAHVLGHRRADLAALDAALAELLARRAPAADAFAARALAHRLRGVARQLAMLDMGAKAQESLHAAQQLEQPGRQ